MASDTAISRKRDDDAIPGYRLEHLVGRGGMGEVHRAIQLSLSRTVAIKLLSSELATDKAFVSRFEKEAAALATLQHPHIVGIVEKGHHKDLYYLVMEFVDGPSLREVMRSPDFSVPRALKIIFDVCRAIDYAHSKGVVHRDLKPENILFDDQAGGIAKVSDFGLASFTADKRQGEKFNLTETHMAMGTASYMAPEQRVDAKNVDGRADIYAIGVMMYELLTGELPVGTFAPPSQKKPSLDKRLDGVVDRCLKPNPADRFQSVAEVLVALEPMVPITTSLVPRKVSRAAQLGLAVQRWVRFSVRAAATLVVLVALSVIAAAIIRSRSPHVAIEQPGQAISAELPPHPTLFVPARVDRQDTIRVVTFGAGPDTVSVVPFGRLLKQENGSLAWSAPTRDALVGRAKLDVSESDGKSLFFTADVTTPKPPDDWRSVAKKLVLGYGPEPRAALVLTGEPGRYMALVTSGTGDPVSFEWSFGEKRGAMLGPASFEVSTLSISIDRLGEARAFMGSGKDKRQIAEPVSLGRDWKKYFGRMPSAQLGCIEAACRFSALRLDIDTDSAPDAVAPKEEKPVVAEKRPPVVEKKPVEKPAPKPVVKQASTHTKGTVEHASKGVKKRK